RITAETPNDAAEQDGVQKTDMVGGEKIAFGTVQMLREMNASQIRQAQQAVGAKPVERLDEHQLPRDPCCCGRFVHASEPGYISSYPPPGARVLPVPASPSKTRDARPKRFERRWSLPRIGPIQAARGPEARRFDKIR